MFLQLSLINLNILLIAMNHNTYLSSACEIAEISCFSKWIGLRLDQEPKDAFDSEIMFTGFECGELRNMLFYIMILSCPEPIEAI